MSFFNTAPAEPAMVCANCRNQSLDLCQCPCRTVYYCGTSCQEDHWPVHGPECTAAIRGHKSLSSCTNCGTASTNLKSCVCGSALYCDTKCQHAHWGTHRRVCATFIRQHRQKKRRWINRRHVEVQTDETSQELLEEDSRRRSMAPPSTPSLSSAGIRVQGDNQSNFGGSSPPFASPAAVQRTNSTKSVGSEARSGDPDSPSLNRRSRAATMGPRARSGSGGGGGGGSGSRKLSADEENPLSSQSPRSETSARSNTENPRQMANPDENNSDPLGRRESNKGPRQRSASDSGESVELNAHLFDVTVGSGSQERRPSSRANESVTGLFSASQVAAFAAEVDENERNPRVHSTSSSTAAATQEKKPSRARSETAKPSSTRSGGATRSKQGEPQVGPAEPSHGAVAAPPEGDSVKEKQRNAAGDTPTDTSTSSSTPIQWESSIDGPRKVSSASTYSGDPNTGSRDSSRPLTSQAVAGVGNSQNLIGSSSAVAGVGLGDANPPSLSSCEEEEKRTRLGMLSGWMTWASKLWHTAEGRSVRRSWWGNRNGSGTASANCSSPTLSKTGSERQNEPTSQVLSSDSGRLGGTPMQSPASSLNPTLASLSSVQISAESSTLELHSTPRAQVVSGSAAAANSNSTSAHPTTAVQTPDRLGDSGATQKTPLRPSLSKRFAARV